MPCAAPPAAAPQRTDFLPRGLPHAPRAHAPAARPNRRDQWASTFSSADTLPTGAVGGSQGVSTEPDSPQGPGGSRRDRVPRGVGSPRRWFCRRPVRLGRRRPAPPRARSRGAPTPLPGQCPLALSGCGAGVRAPGPHLPWALGPPGRPRGWPPVGRGRRGEARGSLAPTPRASFILRSL